MVSAMDKPIALHKEYLPPTQSQNSNILALSIPNAVTDFSLVLSAAKCLAMEASSAPDFKNHSLAVCALVMVSCVVNVLDATKKRVSSGFTFFSVSII